MKVKQASGIRLRGVAAAAVFIVTGAALSGGAARADDLKLTGTIGIDAAQVSDGSAAPLSGQSEAFTVWSHGKQARLDVAGGASTLFDSDMGTVYVLDSGGKTYYKEALKDWKPAPLPQLASALPAQAPGGGSTNVQLGFNQTDNTPGNAQMIGGHDTRKYLIDATIRTQRSGGHRGSGYGGGGSYGGGYGGGFLMSMTQEGSNPSSGLLHTAQFGGYGRRGGGGGGGRYRQGRRSVQVTGDVWLGDGSGYALDGKDNALWAQALVSAWGVGPLTSSLASKLESSGEIPWETHLTTTWSQVSAGDINDDNTGEASNSNSVSTVATLTSISNVELPASLFQVPASYTQVSPPGS